MLSEEARPEKHRGLVFSVGGVGQPRGDSPGRGALKTQQGGMNGKTEASGGSSVKRHK